MNPPVKQRVSPNWVMLILAALLAVWLLVEFFPRKKPLPPPSPVAAESKLRSVGLPDNVDLEGLPEFFAVWANDKRIEWHGDLTYFGYWNPVSKKYSYYIEAEKIERGYRFRLIDDKRSSILDPDWFDDVEEGAVDFGRNARTLSHPIDFSVPPGLSTPSEPWPDLSVLTRQPTPRSEPSKVPVDLKSGLQPLTQPAPPKMGVSDDRK